MRGRMRAVDIIIKKRDGLELSSAEIEYFISGFVRDEIPDYQAAAWAMAVLLRGMSARETADLTLAMARSGEMLDLTSFGSKVVDKHSTGGVGDKTSLVVGPMVAACGLAVGKMSGRGLGFSGGTLDKLDSIPGFKSALTTGQFLEQLSTVGLVIAGQSADLAPADGKMYALRDVTGTVQSLPLIASSIMSKKIAAGAPAIVLDVKVGHGAFMKTIAEGRQLAEAMVSIGKQVGRRTIALLSDMNQPLGRAVGNALELKEALQTLHGEGPKDFRDHCLEVAAYMLVVGGKAVDPAQGWALAAEMLKNGQAWERFLAFIAAQGGELKYLEQPEMLPQAAVTETSPAPQSGYLKEINARIVGETAVNLGAGRAQKEDTIDYGVGIEILHQVGDPVRAGEPLFVVHARDPKSMAAAQERLLSAHEFSAKPVEALPLFYDVIGWGSSQG